MSEGKPWALMRHHAGWADIFHIESETATPSPASTRIGRRASRSPITTMRCWRASRPQEAARAARERGLAERRKHDAAVDAAEAA